MPDGTTKYFINYYISSLFFYARMISATQALIFAIRYWLSATVIQMTERWVTVDRIKVIGWAVSLTYITIQTVDLLIKCILFPGYYDEDGSQQDWFQFRSKFFDPLDYWEFIFYASLTIVSSLLTVYAVVKIFGTSKMLDASNSNVHLNKRAMVLHSLLLVIQCLFMIYFVVAYQQLLQGNNAFVMEPIVDLIVQLLICYICWALGSNSQLKMFDCLLIEDGQGGLTVKYIRKIAVPDTIGVPYATENYSSYASLNSDSLSRPSGLKSFEGQNEMWT